MKFEAEAVPVNLLPKPAGWRILIAPVKIEDISKGGIALLAESVKSQEYFRNIAKVVAMGSECYKHPKFQGGISIEQHEPVPWCKVGDVIQYSAYTGADTVIKFDGKEHKLKIINDDEVISTITDLSILNFV